MQKCFPQISSPLPSFHLPFSLSSSFPICMSSRLHQATSFFPQFPLFSFLSFCFVPSGWCQNKNVFPQIFSVKGFAAIKTRTFSDCFMSSYLFLSSLCLPLCISLHLLSFLCHITHCFPPLSVFLSSSLHALMSFTSLSLPFTNQYAGQQAVWQIVCCELHEKPLSIISVHYWIRSVVFSRVKWKDQGVQNVRWGESERRPAVHFPPFLWRRGYKSVVTQTMLFWMFSQF